jgi:hypothetical protein
MTYKLKVVLNIGVLKCVMWVYFSLLINFQLLITLKCTVHCAERTVDELYNISYLKMETNYTTETDTHVIYLLVKCNFRFLDII